MTLRAVAPDFYGRMGPALTNLTEDRFIKAVEFRERRHDSGSAERKAGDLNYFVVHHAVVMATGGKGDAAIEIDQATGTVNSTSADGARFNVVWELGQNATIYPDALGVKLAAGSALNFDLHTHSVGTEATFSIDVAFKFHPKGYKPKYTATRRRSSKRCTRCHVLASCSASSLTCTRADAACVTKRCIRPVTRKRSIVPGTTTTG
jgi:hypothetical protein